MVIERVEPATLSDVPTSDPRFGRTITFAAARRIRKLSAGSKTMLADGSTSE